MSALIPGARRADGPLTGGTHSHHPSGETRFTVSRPGLHEGGFWLLLAGWEEPVGAEGEYEGDVVESLQGVFWKSEHWRAKIVVSI